MGGLLLSGTRDDVSSRVLDYDGRAYVRTLLLATELLVNSPPDSLHTL